MTQAVTVAPAETSVLSTDELIVWRWRALTQQLPSAGFPAGSHAPAVVYVWATMLVAVVTVLGFAVFDRAGVPAAVSESQQDLMRKVAHSLSLSLTSSQEKFDRTTAELQAGTKPPTPATLATLTGEEGSWSGAAVIQPSTRRPVAANAEAVPLDLLPSPALTDGSYAVMTADGPAIIRLATVGDDQVLAGLQPLLMRSLRLNPDAQHGVYVLTPDGKNYLTQGVDAVPADHRQQLFAGLPGTKSSRTEAIKVREWPDRDLVVSAAPVADTGFVVASVVIAEVTEGTSLEHGLLLALIVGLTAAFGYALMRAALVHPLQLLLHQAKLDACGALTKKRRSLRIAEAYQVAQALAVSASSRIHGKRWRPTVTQGLVAAAVVALLGPAAVVAAALGQPVPRVPAQLIRDEESRVEAISSTLGNAMATGLRTVTSLATDQQTAGPGQVDKSLADALETNHRLRGAYLVDADGKVLASAGRESLRSRAPLPGQGGVVLDPKVDRLPVVYAYRVRGDGRAFVAEYDIDYLLGLLRRADGRAMVVDLDLRTVMDSEGYRVFQPVRNRTVRDVAVAALPGETVSRSTDADDKPVLVAGTALNNPAVAHLEWAVVLDRNIDTLRLATMLERRWALLMATLVTAILVVTLVWQFFIFVRPLRRLASTSERIVSGDFDEPVIPQRHDDIGAIAMCLEICRQVRHTGSARFGGATRLRGSAANYTAVLPMVPQQRKR